MINQYDKLERFAEVINKNAMAQCKKIDKQTAKLRKKQLAEIEAEITGETDKKLTYETERLRNQTNREISALKQESTRKLHQYRDEITESVFKKAEEKLVEFTKSDQYDNYLYECIKQLILAVDGKLTLLVRDCDVEKAKKCVSQLSPESEVKASADIRIGGACAVNADETVFADNTLEESLEKQREVFMAESGLSFDE
ncbi:MAG: V-type ATP synthase subunit E [Acutalibacteraceae bacterium]